MNKIVSVAIGICALTLGIGAETRGGNQVLSFPSADASVNVGLPAVVFAPNQTGEMTIEFWLRRETTSIAPARPFSIRGCSCSGLTITSFMEGNNTKLWLEIGGVTDTASVVTTLREWHHYAIVWRRLAGQIDVYLDGSFAMNHSVATNQIAFCGDSLRFGNECGIGTRGAMDNIRYWSVARTADQIRSEMRIQYSSEQASHQVGLIGSWTFESGNALDGTGHCGTGSLEAGATITPESLPPFDADGDGIVDSLDNCPTVANPDQADCDHNGVGDACQAGNVDCNGNGIPDYCDISSGRSTDADSNGIPDECQPDCNHNNLPDSWEIATGRVPDLNADGIPDTCQGAVVVDSTTDNLGAPSGLDVRSYTFDHLPYAETSVTLTLDAVGDLNNLSEWIDVRLNGGAPMRFFATDGHICPNVPDRAVITLTRDQFNAMCGASGMLAVTLTCPATVDGTECKNAGMTQLRLQYVGIDPATGDCNGNHRLDIAETHDGTTPDCNANKVPDSCDIARGAEQDCNLNGIPDSCEIAQAPAVDCDHNGMIDTCEIAVRGTAVDCDLNGRIDSCQVAESPSQDCNRNGKPDSCDIANGTSADRDANGVPDECQTVHVPGDYGTIQAAIDAAPANAMRIVDVAAGTYAGPINFLGKPVVVRGAGAGQTVLDGSSGQSLSVVRFSGGEPAIAALERVTVRGGLTGSPIPGSPQYLVGGGIFGYQSAASVRECIVEQNVGGFGGGAYFIRCTGEVRGCTFRSNSSGADGGGMQSNQGSQQLVDCVIQGNAANSRGGGMHLVQGTPMLTRVQVTGNVCNNLMGGISWYASGSPTAKLTMNGCTVTGNTAMISFGGIGITDTGLTASSATLQGMQVCSNTPRPNVGGGKWTDLGSNAICDCVGDLNLDGIVNGADVSTILSYWGPNPALPAADITGDGIVNGSDLAAVLTHWGSCGN